MTTVKLNLPHHHYEIRIESGALDHLGAWVRQAAPHERSALLHDAALPSSHTSSALRSLESAQWRVTAHAVDSGEPNKSLETVKSLYDVLLDAKLERRSPVIALGGGVTGDTVGFVAATYLRGVPFIQCPTTLLAMVDASVGGKVGVNMPQGKNLIGAFYQPKLVVIDTLTLKTLNQRELRCGLAECVKHAVIRDGELFDFLEENLDNILSLDTDTLVELVRRNVAIKAAVVMEDETESGVRAHLNFGHTFAHAIEATRGYGEYHHGEAVSLGMLAATRLAADAGRCDAALLQRLTTLLDRIGLPTSADDLAPTEQLVETMRVDKKVADGRIRLVLPDGLGAVSIVSDTPTEAMAAAWQSLRK